jgi:hypothetical protein
MRFGQFEKFEILYHREVYLKGERQQLFEIQQKLSEFRGIKNA